MCGFTGIVANVVFKVFLVLMIFPLPVLAANPYELGEVDYFGHPEIVKDLKQTPFDWRDVTRDPQGQTIVYTPPVPVINLLENPTRENAKAYLDWQRQKVQRIMKAQEMIDQVLKEEAL
jgi:hypothetical protein